MKRTLLILTGIATVASIAGFICFIISLMCRIARFVMTQKVQKDFGEDEYRGAMGSVIQKGGEA